MQSAKPQFKIQSFCKISFILSLIFGFILLFAVKEQKVEALSQKDITPPRPPQGFSVKIKSSTALEIFWQENQEWDIFSYLLYVRSGDEKEGKSIYLGKTDYFVLENLKPEITYYLSLTARDIAGLESKPTPEIGISPYEEKVKKDFSIATWLVSQDIKEGQKTLEDNLELFDQVSPFEYKVEEDGRVSRTAEILSNEMVEKLKNKSIKIIPTITNNSDENDKASKILADEKKRKEHLETILREVEEQNYDGIDLDYENLKEEVKRDFNQFVRELSEALHSKGKILSVTLQAKTSDFEMWRGTGALDFEELGKYADQVRLMIYDFSRPNSSPGSIAPIRWISQVIDYAKTKISQEKIIAGLPNYAYRWCLEKKTEDCESKGLVYEGVRNIIEKYKPKVEWNETTKTPWFLYEDEGQNKFAVNFENYQSLEEKLRVVKEKEIGGIVIWRLGGEDPDNYKIMREQLISKIGPPKNLKVVPDNNKIHLEWENVQDKDLKGYRIILKSKEEDSLTNNGKAYSQQESFDVFGKTNYDLENLENGKAYYVSFQPLLWSEDTNPSLSRRDIQESRPILATPLDLIPPAKVLDLKIEEIGTTTLTISFSAPGDDKNIGQAQDYELRYSPRPINEDNFWQAVKIDDIPKPDMAGTKQEIIISDLEPGETYYLALVSFDEAENFSEISNVASARTIDNLPPKAPQVPQVISENQALTIRWAKNQEKDLAGYKIYFQQEKSYYETVMVGPEITSYRLKNLENGYRYFIALSSFDYSGNESARSENAEGKPEAGDFYEKAKNTSSRSYEVIRGQTLVFGKKLITPEAIPYLVMFSIIILNFIIYRALRGEIKERVEEKIIPAVLSPLSNKNVVISDKKRLGPRVVDLKKNKGRVVLR
ncbi:MAG: glycosyl hydrolase family 18 protein [Patescibacteria group bacterium]